MYIELTAVDGVLAAAVKQADDFKRFHLLVDDSVDGDAGAGMASVRKYGWITEDGQFVIAHVERP